MLKKHSRSFSGKLARDAGFTFEELFRVHCRKNNITFIKIPDGCYRIKSSSGVRLVPCKTPFDFFICRSRMSAAIDAKTTEGNSFSYSSCDQDQVQSLFDIGQEIPSGYVIWFRQSGLVSFFDHTLLRNLKRQTSLKDTEGLCLGNIDEFNPTLILHHLNK